MDKRHHDIAGFVRGKRLRITALIRWNYSRPDYTEVKTFSGEHYTDQPTGERSLAPPGFGVMTHGYDNPPDYNDSRILVAYRDVIELTEVAG